MRFSCDIWKYNKLNTQAAANRPIVKSVTVGEKLRKLLVSIKNSRAEDGAKIAFKTLLTLSNNLAKSPETEKFRRINLYNSAIQARIGVIPEAISFLKLCGFTSHSDQNGEFLAIQENAVDKVSWHLRRFFFPLAARKSRVILS